MIQYTWQLTDSKESLDSRLFLFNLKRPYIDSNIVTEHQEVSIIHPWRCQYYFHSCIKDGLFLHLKNSYWVSHGRRWVLLPAEDASVNVVKSLPSLVLEFGSAVQNL